MKEQKIAVIGFGLWGRNIVRNFYNLNVLEMVCDLEEKLKELQNQPFILYNKKNKAISKETSASKLYKSLSQIYDNKIKIIIKAVKKNNSLDDDGLEEFLSNWRNGE